jgi:hypothetical protein
MEINLFKGPINFQITNPKYLNLYTKKYPKLYFSLINNLV